MQKLIHSLSTRSAMVGLAALLLLGNAGVADAQAAFTRDLTLGSSGADVTALQTLLISKGFSIPAGATGYFGAQTSAALAAYQAANGIVPAAGYFGPITRGRIDVTVPSGTGTNPGSGSSTSSGSSALKGDEADLRKFNLTREEASGDEGEEDVRVATATFDVEGGDIRIERVELLVSASNSALSVQPWKYFDRISVLANGKTVTSEDVDSRNDWSEVKKGTYRLTLTNLKQVVREGDSAELTFALDISDRIDSADLSQRFTFSVADRGIRATDAAGIQQYAGSDDDKATFGFGAEENGDLTIQTSDENPYSAVLIADDKKESKDYDVFTFEIRNSDGADATLNELAIDVSDLGVGIDASDVIRRAKLKAGRQSFTGEVNADTLSFDDLDVDIGGDDTVTFELSVRLARNAPATTIAFGIQDSSIDAEGAKSGDRAEVSGNVKSDLHQIALDGVTASSGKTAAKSQVINSATGSEQGEFTLTFDVTALEQTAYISRSADTATSTLTAGIAYNVYLGNELVELAPSEIADFLEAARSDTGDTDEYYLVREGRTRTFTLHVSINPDVTGYYSVELQGIRFDDARDGVGNDSIYLVPAINEFKTPAEQLNA